MELHYDYTKPVPNCNLSQILTAMWVGDAYRLSDVEQCLAWLQSDRIHLSCPFEQAMGRTLAQAFIAQKTMAALKEIPA